eukprot:5279410-Prymnesium_polylepis.1
MCHEPASLNSQQFRTDNTQRKSPCARHSTCVGDVLHPDPRHPLRYLALVQLVLGLILMPLSLTLIFVK